MHLSWRIGELKRGDNLFLDRNGAHQPSGLPLETGQTSTFHAWRGLNSIPDYDLLELSWDLRRVAAISGTSREPEALNYEHPDDWFDTDEEDDDSGSSINHGGHYDEESDQ
ncbi:hypothetical protein TrVGV298_002691 [Trichoderma virens]|nr:hypothetical protein TrVGV298_002691 [Trichoderma virens]